MANRNQVWLIGCGLMALAALTVAGLFMISLAWLGGGPGLGAAFAGAAVGHVVIQGPITDARRWVEELDAHRTDSSVKAVVVRIDSPGGAVAPSQELHAAIVRLADAKPVVASLGSVAASGGYYAAVAADSIVANPGTLTGSIGVIFEFPTMPDLLAKLGVQYRVYKSGALKDMGSFAREPSDEEGDVLDSIIEDVYDQFVVAVSDGRGLPRADVEALADGRVFSGRQAMRAGLVDRMGTEHDALRMAASLAGLSGNPRVVRKGRPVGQWLALFDRLLRENSYFTNSRVLSYRYR